MATFAAAEVAADAILIGRYFGRRAAATLATASGVNAAVSAAVRPALPASEDYGPGVRGVGLSGSASAPGSVGLPGSLAGGGLAMYHSAAGGALSGPVRFMSMFGGRARGPTDDGGPAPRGAAGGTAF